MKLLNRKMIRDLKATKGQMISLMIIVSLGVMLYSGINATFLNLDGASKSYYSDYKLADYWIHVTEAPVQLKKTLVSLPEITEVTLRLTEELTLPINDLKATVRVHSLPDVNTNHLNDVKITHGTYFNDSELQQVLVEEQFYKAHNLSVGSVIQPLFQGKPVKLKVIGSVKSPEYVYMLKDGSELMPDPQRFGVIYLKESFAQSLFNKKGNFNQILLKLLPETDLTLFKAKMEKELKSNGIITLYERDKLLSHTMLSEEMKGLKSVSGAFPSLFLFVAGIILYLMMGRLVEQQRTQIGVLKAFGFSNGSILSHYLSYALLVSIIGSILGAIIGVFLGQGMTELENAYFHLPLEHMRIYPELVLPATGLTLFFCIVASLKACSNAFKLSPSEALRPKSPPIGKKILLERLENFWRLLNFAWKMVLRNIFRYKKRTMLTLIGIVFGASLLLVSLGMMDTVNNLIKMQYNVMMNYDLKITLKNSLKQSEWQDISVIDHVKMVEPILETAFTIESGNYKKTIGFMGLSPNGHLIKILNTEQEQIPIPHSGVLLPQTILDKLSSESPKMIRLTPVIPGLKKSNVPISGGTTQFLGQTAYGSIEATSSWLQHEPIANAFVVQIDHDKYAPLIKDKLLTWSNIKSVDTKSEAMENLMKNVELMTASISILVLLSGILSISVIYNVSTINIFERQRELATLKVMGFNNKEIRSVIFFENYLITWLSGLLSLPLGLLLGKAMMKMYETEAYNFVFEVNWPSFVITFILTNIFAGLSNRLLIKKIDSLDMVSVLKNIE